MHITSKIFISSFLSPFFFVSKFIKSKLIVGYNPSQKNILIRRLFRTLRAALAQQQSNLPWSFWQLAVTLCPRTDIRQMSIEEPFRWKEEGWKLPKLEQTKQIWGNRPKKVDSISYYLQKSTEVINFLAGSFMISASFKPLSSQKSSQNFVFEYGSKGTAKNVVVW